MWFIFPQLRGLGCSATALHYGIASPAEAEADLAHPILGPRLRHCTTLVTAIRNCTAHQTFGSPDDLKLHSCLTLFAQTAGTDPIFAAALAQYFDALPDPASLRLLQDP